MQKPVPSPAPPCDRDEAPHLGAEPSPTLPPVSANPSSVPAFPTAASAHDSSSSPTPSVARSLSGSFSTASASEQRKQPAVGDFVCISEFAEQFGPVPQHVIPENGQGRFNLSSFVVRIMATDYQKKNSDFGEFAEDSQVVMPEPSANAWAYVHHLTLLDIHARGFVRPICISYITHDAKKLMSNFSWVMRQISEVSTTLKHGNQLLFLRDIEERLAAALDSKPSTESPDCTEWDAAARSSNPMAVLSHLIGEARDTLQSGSFAGTNLAMSRLVLMLSGALEVQGDSVDSTNPDREREMRLISSLHKARNFEEALRPLPVLCEANYQAAIDRVTAVHKAFSVPTSVLMIEKEEADICGFDPGTLDVGRVPLVSFKRSKPDAKRAGPRSFRGAEFGAETDGCMESFARKLWPEFKPTGLLELRNDSPFLKHVVWSLLRGRTVVVMSSGHKEWAVKWMVRLLSIFVPRCLSTSVESWRTMPLRICDLGRLKLIGMKKQRSGLAIPKCIERYVSILDLEQGWYQGPVYEGVFLNSLFSTKKSWPTDETFAASIYETLTHVASYSCLLHQMCCGDSARSEAVAVESVAVEFQKSFELGTCDMDVIKNLCRVVEEQQFSEVVSSGEVMHTLNLDYRAALLSRRLNAK